MSSSTLSLKYPRMGLVVGRMALMYYSRQIIGTTMLGLLLCWVLCLLPISSAFHSGAPVEACDSMLPRHLHTSAKPIEDSPYVFTASAGRFYPDSKRRKIKVRIRGAPFKGFFVVALDADTHERVGEFLDARGMEPVPCSAVTHTDGRPKIMATMLWQPPQDRKRGDVLFLATILESFSSYYSGLMASIPSGKSRKRIPKKDPSCGEYPSCHELHQLKNTTLPNIL